MNHIGDTNKMVGEDHLPDASKMVSDTPRTDEAVWQIEGGEMVCPKFCRQLERELNAANQRIKRLEEAGDGLMKSINCGCPYGPSVFNCQTCTNSWDSWRKAKEAKP